MKIFETLKDLTSTKQQQINDWFKAEHGDKRCMFYNSIDIRYSGHKIAPVDTNIFPGGFNNLSKESLRRATEVASDFLHTQFPEATKLLIIGESHTRNLYYLENLFFLEKILQDTGKEVRISNFKITNKHDFKTVSGTQITMHPLEICGDYLCAGNDKYKPDLIIINNDLTGGAPEILQNIKQCVIPPVGLGWYQRRKSRHFAAYTKIIESFCKEFEIEPFLLSAEFLKCGNINFAEKTGMECVANNVDKIIHKLKGKYSELGINSEPYVFIKSDKGTYGMGIMIAHSGQAVYEINKKTKNQMKSIKSGETNTEVIIQEGIPSTLEINSKIAQPVVYTINQEPIGMFYRTNDKKDKYTNLNSSGMGFVPELDMASDNFKVFSLISRLAVLAASKECD